jgi:phosphotransferase system, enzyme I, PtsP
VATLDEFERAKTLVRREHAYLTRHGYDLPVSVALGVMVEVPSLLFQLEEIAERADFLSVGSNDLMQFLFAADRDNAQVAHRFDCLSVPFLRALRHIACTASAKNCPVTLCGEIGGRPLEAMALIGLGFRKLSMSPASIGPIKAMVLALDTTGIAALLERELAGGDSLKSLRPLLTDFAHSHHIPI